MSYRTTRQRHGARPAPKRGRSGAAYRKVLNTIRDQARAGRPCYFQGVCPHCPGAWNWGLPHNHGDAFTMHHLDRVMDGGVAVPTVDRAAPAHRRCNAWDGLVQQNRKRGSLPTVVYTESSEPQSRTW